MSSLLSEEVPVIIELRFAELYGLMPGRGDADGEIAGTLAPRAWREPRGEPASEGDDGSGFGSCGAGVDDPYGDGMGDPLPAPLEYPPPAPNEDECLRGSVGDAPAPSNE